MSNRILIKTALRAQHIGNTSDFDQQRGMMLQRFCRPAGYPYQVRLQQEGSWSGWDYDEGLNLVLPRREVTNWLMVPTTGLLGAWDTCMVARKATKELPARPFGHVTLPACSKETTYYDLIVSFEHVDDAVSFKMMWEGRA